MSMGRKVIDASERQKALDINESFIVQAPAGSGKTELLIQRYLALLSCVDNPEEVVAITFTRKAAAEMHARIIEAIEGAVSGMKPESPSMEVTLKLAGFALAQNSDREWDIRSNPNRLRIMTMDALCARITRQTPISSSFGSQPGIVEDAGDYYFNAARSVLELLEGDSEVSEAVRRLSMHLDNNLTLLEEMIASMLSKRDQWARHIGSNVNVQLQREKLEESLKNIIRDELTYLHKIIPEGITSELLELNSYAAENLKLSGLGDGGITEMDSSKLPGVSFTDAGAWMGIRDLVLTKEGTWRKTVNKNQGFPPKGAGETAGEKDFYQRMKDRFMALVDTLNPNELLREKLDAVAILPPPCYENSQWEIVEALLTLLPEAIRRLRKIFSGAGAVDFSEVSQAAIQSLAKSNGSEDTFDFRIQHLLVDEFQDTSLSQNAMLEQIMDGWANGDGRTIFTVGDPMQSIYRFREAEVGVFLRSRREGIGSVKLTPISLTVNFRSQAGVVEWVNDIFSHVMPATDNMHTSAVSYAQSSSFHAPLKKAAVTVHPSFGYDHYPEGQKVVNLVKAAKSEHPEGTAAILVRSRSHLIEIIPCLRDAGIKFKAVEIEQLGHRPVIQDIYSLTRAIVHLADRIAWLAILRAPWCGLTLHDIYKIAGDEHHVTIWDLINNAERIKKLSKDGRKRVTMFRNVMAGSIALLRKVPLRHLVEGAWLALGGPASLSNQTDVDDAQVFLELIDELDRGGDLEDTNKLGEMVEKLFASPDVGSDDSLQIMTIHKAKGLEFDTVILPGLDRVPRTHESQLLLWMERPRGGDRDDLVLAPIKKASENEDSIYLYLNAIDNKKGFHEDGRLFYVAATRAKRRLRLLGNVKYKFVDGKIELSTPSANSLLSQIWPYVEQTFVAASESIESDSDTSYEDEYSDDDQTIQRHINRFDINWSLPSPSSSLTLDDKLYPVSVSEHDKSAIEFNWASEIAKHIGTVVHSALQQISTQGIENWDAKRVVSYKPVYKHLLAKMGVPGDELENAANRVCISLTSALEDERGRWILSDSHEQAACEYPLTGVIDGKVINVIIDRTFIDEKGARWIIDYKTGSHEGGNLDEFLDREKDRYQTQLDRYATIMSNLKSMPIYLGLYFPTVKGWRKWEYSFYK